MIEDFVIGYGVGSCSLLTCRDVSPTIKEICRSHQEGDDSGVHDNKFA